MFQSISVECFHWNHAYAQVSRTASVRWLSLADTSSGSLGEFLTPKKRIKSLEPLTSWCLFVHPKKHIEIIVVVRDAPIRPFGPNLNNGRCLFIFPNPTPIFSIRLHLRAVFMEYKLTRTSSSLITHVSYSLPIRHP